MLPFAVTANRRDRPIEKREEERASFILSSVERGMQSPQLSQLPLVTSVIIDQCPVSSGPSTVLGTIWGSVAADSAVDFASHVRRARV